MNVGRFGWAAAVVLVIGVGSARTNAGGDVAAVMKMMPADYPLAIVVPNFEKFDKTITSVQQRFKPGSDEGSMLEELRSELEIGKWVDFSQPIGMASPTVGGGDEWMVVWAAVPNAAAKLKEVENAQESDGIWEVPQGEDDTFFVAVKGNYVVAANTREAVTKANNGVRSLADVFKSRMDMLANRDALIHIDFAAVRPVVQAGLAQANQMIPMIAMMAGQQGGGDPAGMMGALTGLVESINSLVDQLSFVDVTVGVSEKAADITLATGFNDGPIKNYLSKQKPASMPLLTQISEQPYFAAFAYHIPGETSPFFDFLFEKISKATDSAGMPGVPPDDGGGDSKAAIKESLAAMHKFYAKIEALNTVMGASTTGMRVTADYVGPDPKSLVELVKKSITSANPMMQQFGGGGAYEALGSQKMGDTTVEQFAMKIDTTNPAGAMAAQMYGEAIRFGVGAAGDRVRFCMGSEEEMKRAFAGRVMKPFAFAEPVKQALAAMPAKRNAVMLVDPAGILPIVGPLMGMPKMDPIPPGPPIAATVSLSGEPARVDIHIPLRAIERLMQASAPDEPM